LNSTNGTYVNGKLIKKHALQHGDVVTVGHHQLRFVEDDEAQDEFEKTMVIQPSSRPAAEKMRAAKDVAEKVSADLSASGARKGLDGKTPVKKAKLQVLSGSFAGRELELNKALTTLGRPGIQVAAITRRQDGFFIVHVDSDTPNNYPLVNGAAIGSQARKLIDNDVIQLAGVKMGFFEG
jgi:pSer/pThr/pTyr-binding forkhead associated (FHA) protein